MKCKKCNSTLKTEDKMCQNCGELVSKDELKVQKLEPKNENIILGIIGAILGSCAGVVAIIAFDYIGFVASLSGLIMGLCTVLLYKKFAGSISVKGIIISVIIMILMTYFAVKMTYVIQILKYAKTENIDTSFSHVFKNFGKIIEAFQVKTDYFLSLGMVYLFTILGSAGTIIAEFKQIKENK